MIAMEYKVAWQGTICVTDNLHITLFALGCSPYRGRSFSIDFQPRHNCTAWPDPAVCTSWSLVRKQGSKCHDLSQLQRKFWTESLLLSESNFLRPPPCLDVESE